MAVPLPCSFEFTMAIASSRVLTCKLVRQDTRHQAESYAYPSFFSSALRVHAVRVYMRTSMHDNTGPKISSL